MTTDPRVALNMLVQTLEEHLNAVASKRGEEDSTVEAAYYGIADAFEAYEDALYAAYDEVTPLEVFVEDDGEEDEDLLEADEPEEDLADEDYEEDFEDESEESADAASEGRRGR